MDTFSVAIKNAEGELVCEGFILDENKSSMKVRLFDDYNEIGYLSEGEQFVITVFNPYTGLKVFDVEVVSHTASHIEFLKVEQKSAIQRREDSRVSISETVIVSKIKKEDKDEVITLPKQLTFECTNISAGGIFLVTNIKLPIGLKLYVEVKSLGINTYSKIVRIEDRQGRYGYGCKFVGISEDKKAEIRRLVFKRQAELQRRKAN